MSIDRIVMMFAGAVILASVLLFPNNVPQAKIGNISTSGSIRADGIVAMLPIRISPPGEVAARSVGVRRHNRI